MSDEEAGDIFLVKLKIARDVIVRSAFFSLFYFCFYGFRFNHTYTKKLNKNNLSLPGRLDIFLKMENKSYICCNREVDSIPHNENVEITAHMLFSLGSDRREIIRI